MLEATVGDLLDDKLSDIIYQARDRRESESLGDWIALLTEPSSTDHVIYLARDGDVVFYVGQSVDVTSRLNEHLGREGRRGATYPSALGRVILSNLPKARDWTVELWTVQGCKEALANAITKHWRWDADEAEQRMILARRPCLNLIHNRDGRRLPARYRDVEAAKVANEGVTLR